MKRASELFVGSLHEDNSYHIAGTNWERNQNHAFRRLTHSVCLEIPRSKRGQSNGFSRLRKNYVGTPELHWFACLRQARSVWLIWFVLFIWFI